MTAPAAHYFVLIVPACMIMLGLALLACWHILRQQHFLPWLAIGYILPALALGAQSLMSNAQLANWSVTAATLYLGGTWALVYGMAQRVGGRLRHGVALSICLTALAFLHYYAHITDQLWIRALVLNIALGLLYFLPLGNVLQRTPDLDWLERVMGISYVLSAASPWIRALLIVSFIPTADVGELTRSGYWLLMLSVTLLVSIWFMLVLLACAMRDAIHVLRKERNHDPLTHLLNRRAFFEAAGQVLEDKRQAPWSLLVCDIDHFKQVNDTWGHAAGDQVLETVAQVLQAQVRQCDLAARFGGEEFVVLLARTDTETAHGIAQRIRSSLSHTHFESIERPVTASFGLAPVASLHELPEALEFADTALYRAKQDGRDRVCVHINGNPAH